MFIPERWKSSEKRRAYLNPFIKTASWFHVPRTRANCFPSGESAKQLIGSSPKLAIRRGVSSSNDWSHKVLFSSSPSIEIYAKLFPSGIQVSKLPRTENESEQNWNGNDCKRNAAFGNAKSGFWRPRKSGNRKKGSCDWPERQSQKWRFGKAGRNFGKRESVADSGNQKQFLRNQFVN